MCKILFVRSAHHEREVQSTGWGPGPTFKGPVDALSTYMRLVFKHSATKRDYRKKKVDLMGGGGGGVDDASLPGSATDSDTQYTDPNFLKLPQISFIV